MNSISRMTVLHSGAELWVISLQSLYFFSPALTTTCVIFIIRQIIDPFKKEFDPISMNRKHSLHIRACDTPAMATSP